MGGIPWPRLGLMPWSLPLASLLTGVGVGHRCLPQLFDAKNSASILAHLVEPADSLIRGLGPMNTRIPALPYPHGLQPVFLCISLHKEPGLCGCRSAAGIGKESDEKLFRKAWVKAGAT